MSYRIPESLGGSVAAVAHLFAIRLLNRLRLIFNAVQSLSRLALLHVILGKVVNTHCKDCSRALKFVHVARTGVGWV